MKENILPAIRKYERFRKALKQTTESMCCVRYAYRSFEKHYGVT